MSPWPRYCLLVFLCCVAILRPVVAHAASDAGLPDTPAGKALGELLTAYNTGEIDSLRSYFLAHATQPTPKEREEAAARRAAWVYRIYTTHRELRLDRIERSAEWDVAALLQSVITEGWCQFEVEVDATPPHGVGIGFSEAPRPDRGAAGVKRSQAEILAGLDAYVDRLVAAELFSGAILVAKDGVPIFQEAHGWEDATAKVPNRVDSRFPLGSMNKMFTAVAIAQLAQEGRLSFEDPIGKHLPAYPNRDTAARVTIHHLLTHTSGMGDYLDKEAFQAAREAAGGRFETSETYFPFFTDDSLLFEPGERFEYSNAGFIVLGAIVEAVSKQGYFDYVIEHILEPTGMKSTDPRGKNGSPAGSAVSTVGDLFLFAKALQAHRLLNASTTEQILTPRVDANIGGRYAYGFIVRSAGKDGRIVGHDGGSGGVSTKLDIYLDQGYIVVILENIDPPAARNVAAKLEELIGSP